MLEEKLERLKGVWCSIEYYNGKFAVSAAFPEGYSVFTDSLDRIQVVNDTDKSGKYWYIGKDNAIRISDIIDFIDETVKINEEAIKKAKLYEEKVKELRDCFNNDKFSYRDLERLSFSVRDELNTQQIGQVVTKPMPKKPVVPKNGRKPKEEANGEVVTEAEKAATEVNKQPVKDNSTQAEKPVSTEPKTANFSDFKAPKDSKGRKIINNVDVTDLIGEEGGGTEQELNDEQR